MGVADPFMWFAPGAFISAMLYFVGGGQKENCADLEKMTWSTL
jgi:hypothetical protein